MSGSGSAAGSEFRFLNISHPSEGRNRKVQKGVRSHVTTRQHRLQRAKKRENEQASSSSDARSSEASSGSGGGGGEAVEKDGSGEGTSIIHRPVQDHNTSSATNRLGPGFLRRQYEARISAEQALNEDHAGDSSESPAEANAARQRDDAQKGLLTPRALVHSSATSSKASRTCLLFDPNDDMASTLEPMRLDFSMIMDHYQWIVATQATDFSKQFLPHAPPSTGYDILVQEVWRDPALLASAILVATGHILSIRNVSMSQETARCIYELRSYAIHRINQALKEPNRAISDRLLAAVLILATHEGLQGSVDNFHIHMQGLVRMINLRGGLRSLNKDHRCLKEFIIWQDTNVCTIMRVKPYHLQCDESDNPPVAKPNPRLWLLLDAVRD